MKISEIFWSIQGEGDNIGKPAIFIRFSGCNLNCNFCDSKFSRTNFKEMNEEEIFDEIKKYNCNRIVITGGEPLFNDLLPLLKLLKSDENNYYVEIETNGTISSNNDIIWLLVDKWNVSLKLESSGNPFEKRIIPFSIIRFVNIAQTLQKVEFKFVVKDKNDFNEVLYLINSFNIPKEFVTIMPCGITLEEITLGLQNLVELCKKENIRLLPRLQIQIWGNKRNV